MYTFDHNYVALKPVYLSGFQMLPISQALMPSEMQTVNRGVIFFFFFCVLKAGQPLPSLVWRMRCAYSPKRIPKSIQYRCLAMSLKHIFLYFSETLLVFHVTNQLLVDLINCKIFLKLFFFSIRYFSSFLFLTVAAFEGSCCHQIQNLVIFS